MRSKYLTIISYSYTLSYIYAKQKQPRAVFA